MLKAGIISLSALWEKYNSTLQDSSERSELGKFSVIKSRKCQFRVNIWDSRTNFKK